MKVSVNSDDSVILKGSNMKLVYTEEKKNTNPRESHKIPIYISNMKNFVTARAERRTQLSCHQQTSLQGNAAAAYRNSWAYICKLLLYKIKDFEYPLDTGFANTYCG